MRACGTISCMKTTAFLFLFALLSAAPGAEERLIPFDEFFISVAFVVTPKLEVAVQVQRGGDEPQGRTGIALVSPTSLHSKGALEPDEVASLVAACDAALNARAYHKEIWHGNEKWVYETVKVDDHTRVSVGGVVFEWYETLKLKEALVQATVAEAWFKKLLTERTLPAQTAVARPLRVRSPNLNFKVGEVSGDGLTYAVALKQSSSNPSQQYQVQQVVNFKRPGGYQGNMYGVYGGWIGAMMEQVALALDAVQRKKDFTYEAPPDAAEGRYGKFSVTANLTTQKADVVIDMSRPFEKPNTSGIILMPRHLNEEKPLVQGSFAVRDLAAIRKLTTQGEAWAKWFAEHEAWFFEGK